MGLAMKLSGTVFVKRAQHEKAIASLNSAVKKAKDTGTSIFIFPEGTRHLAAADGKGMLPFKKGAFHMAIDAGLPILPVVISEYDFLDRKKKRFGHSAYPSEVCLTIMKPIDTTGMLKENINELIETTRNEMIEVFQKDKEERLSRRKVASKKND